MPASASPTGPAIKTTQAPAAGLVGGVFNDNVTNAGPISATPTPTLHDALPIYEECKGTPAAEDSIAVTNGNATYETPKGATLGSVGTYYWVRSEERRVGKEGRKSGWEAEPVEVTPAGPAIKTTQAPAAGLVGGVFKDKATISGLFGATPGGTITWKLYESEEGKGTPAAEDSIAVTNGNATYETPKGATLGSVGTYYWVRSEERRVGKEGRKSGWEAEPVEVTPAGPAIKTTQAPAAGLVGGVFKDKATISGLFGATPGGTITWKLYESEEGKGTPAAEDSIAVTNGNATYETPKGATLGSVGTYYWVRSEERRVGKEGRKSGWEAEPVEVTPAGPAIKTTQAPAAGLVGGVFKDKATISGLFGATPGGTITWKLYESEEGKGTPAAEDSIAVTNGNATYETPKGATLGSVGTYYWVRSEERRVGKEGRKSGWEAEPVEVTPAGPAIKTTQAPAAGLVGGVFKDKATISGLFGATPGGTITWKLYESEEGKGTPAAEDSIAVTNGNATYETPKGATLGSVGTYYWVASYSGDHNNSATKSGCEAEPVEVTPAGPAIKTTQAPAAGLVGGVFKDKATISGLFGATHGGTISCPPQRSSELKGTPAAEDSIAVTNGNATYETPKGATLGSVGTYYWVASYSGD